MIEIAIGIGIGISSLGIFYVIFTELFKRTNKLSEDKADKTSLSESIIEVKQRLDKKILRTEFNEYCKRMDDNLTAGREKFESIETHMADSTRALKELCVAIGRLEERKKIGKD